MWHIEQVSAINSNYTKFNKKNLVEWCGTCNFAAIKYEPTLK